MYYKKNGKTSQYSFTSINLDSAWVQMLIFISNNPGCTTDEIFSKISKLKHVSKPTLQSLMVAGYVTCIRDKNDLRRKLYDITSNGMKHLNDIVEKNVEKLKKKYAI